MTEKVEGFLSQVPAMLSHVSDYTGQFESFLHDNFGALSPTVVYLTITVIALLLLVYIVKLAIKMTLFVVLPTVGCSLIALYAFPSVDPSKVLPIAAVFFSVLFIWKH
jgi:hypothetical protein